MVATSTWKLKHLEHHFRQHQRSITDVNEQKKVIFLRWVRFFSGMAFAMQFLSPRLHRKL
jgi:hypothetical protein